MLDRYDQDLLLDYLEGELDADRRAQLDALLAEDRQLAALLTELANDRAALRALPKAQAPADLSHDLNASLERRMLLDEAATDTGPIPLARGRELTNEPTGGLRWGRVLGLTGLAASVALAAGIIVVTMGQDPLKQTADKLAEPGTDNESEGLAQAPINRGTTVSGLADAAPSADAPTAAERSRNSPDARGAAEPAPNARRLTDGDRPATRSEPGRSDLSDPAVRTGGDRNTASLASRARRPEPETVLALAVTQARQQLVLVTDQPKLTREQLVTYCISNGIPIIQNDAPANDPGRRAAQRFAGPAEPADDSPVTEDANFALVIDNDKLDALVFTLNNSITLDTEGVGRRAMFSNQTALVTDLDTVQARLMDAGNGAAAVADDQATADAATTDETPPATQQPIELRLPPDLGSEYLNTRNRDNLFVEQQRTGKPYNTAPSELNPAGQQDPADNPPATAADEAAREDQPAADALKQAAQEKDAVDEEQADLGARSGPAAQPEAPQPPAEQAPATIDPTRGNWLAPHLPLARTTPILTWRRQGTAGPPQIVPILIRQASTDHVNSLRLRQRAEAQPAETPADAEAQPEPPAAAETDAGEDQ